MKDPNRIERFSVVGLSSLCFALIGVILVWGFQTAFPRNGGVGQALNPEVVKVTGAVVGALIPFVTSWLIRRSDDKRGDPSGSAHLLSDIEPDDPVLARNYYKALLGVYESALGVQTDRLRTSAERLEELGRRAAEKKQPSRTRFCLLALVLYGGGLFLSSSLSALIMAISFPNGTKGLDVPWYLNSMHSLLHLPVAFLAGLIAAWQYYKQPLASERFADTIRIGFGGILAAGVMFFAMASPETLAQWAESSIHVLWTTHNSSVFLIFAARSLVLAPFVGYLGSIVAFLAMRSTIGTGKSQSVQVVSVSQFRGTARKSTPSDKADAR